jgi:nucleotide-binding universal stress UspA family protein
LKELLVVFYPLIKNEIDLIVMGSHGTSGIEEMVIGSNTEKIVRLSEIRFS